MAKHQHDRSSRSASVSVRLRPRELAKVRRAARDAGLSVSEWVRRLAARAMGLPTKL